MMLTVALLFISNLFMTLAWYGPLRFTDRPIWQVVLASWGIAFIEYCFTVPANRIGYAAGLTAGRLKVIQEVVTLLVFAGFSVAYLGEALRWNHAGAFVCLVGAVAFMFAGDL